MTQPSLQELAKQGNPKAIAAMLNRSLQPKSISAKVGRKDDCLQILLESAQPPAQQAMVSFIRKGLTNLGLESVKTVKIYARQTGEESPAWQQVFNLISEVDTSSSNQQTDTQNSLPGATLYNTSKPVSLREETPASARQTSAQNLRSSPDTFKKPSPRPSLRPLSVGNVVSAGLRLYREHFKLYLGLAFRALLWAFIPIYGWAKSYQIQAIIARQAFSELINQPESISTIQTQLNSRFWSFWLAQLLIGLIGFGVNLGLYLVSGVVVGIPTAILLGTSNADPGASAIIILIQNVVNLITLVVYLWFYCHFFIAELPLAVENSITSTSCINRSWELTKGSVARIQLIVLVASLITLPILLLALAPLMFLIPSFMNVSSVQSLVYGIISLVFWALILVIVGSTLMMPFWQAIKAVIYYDLRSRREGLGLQMRDSVTR